MILKNIKAVFLSNIVIQIMGFVSSFVVKWFIGPSTMGIWNLVSIITDYIQRFNLGMPAAAQREMPYYLGKGDLGREQKVRETYFAMVIIEVILASAVFLLFFFIKGNFLAVSFWFLYLLAPFYAMTTRIYTAMVDCIQSRQHFVELSKQNIYISVAGVILTILGGWLGGIIGLFIGFALLYLFRVYLGVKLAQKAGFKFTIKFHYDVFKELFRFGFLIQIASYIWGIFLTIDSVLAAQWLGVKQLAFYALGVQLYRQLLNFPAQVNAIFFPRMMQKYGKENNINAISNDVFVFCVGNIVVLIPFLYLSGAFLVPCLIRVFIGNYAPAIEPARILLFCLFFAPQTGILMNVYFFRKQTGHFIFFNASALVILFISIWLFNFRGASLFNIALGTLAGYAILFYFMFILSNRSVLSVKEKIKILMLQFGMMAFTGTVFFMLEKMLPVSGSSKYLDLGYTAIKIMISTIVCLPFAIYGLRLSNTWDKVKQEMGSTWDGLKIRIRSFIPDTMEDDQMGGLK